MSLHKNGSYILDLAAVIVHVAHTLKKEGQGILPCLIMDSNSPRNAAMLARDTFIVVSFTNGQTNVHTCNYIVFGTRCTILVAGFRYSVHDSVILSLGLNILYMTVHVP